jgi:hypothetical protein
MGHDRFVARTIGAVLAVWWSPRREPGQVDRRPTVALEDVHLIGKEGDLLMERQRSITTVDEAVTLYTTATGADPAWRLAVAVLERLGPAEVARLAPELSRDTRWAMRKGRQPRPAIRAAIFGHLRVMAARALGQFDPDASTEGLLAALAAHLDSQPRLCPCCGAPLPPGRARCGNEACRSRSRRSAARPDPEPVMPRRRR